MAEYNPSKIIKDGNTYNFTDSTKIPLSGTNALAGSIVPSTDNAYDFGSSTYKLRYVYADTAYVTNLNINGTAAGDILTHNADEFVPRSGGAVITGNLFARIDDTGYLVFRGGSGYDRGAQITLYGKDVSGYEGYVYLRASDGVNASELALRPNSHATISCASFRPLNDNPTLGDAEYRWGQIYSTNSTISISDERQKDNIKQIDDKLLNAWENVNIVQFNFKDALEKKGEKARLHTGYIAQNIQQACEENGVNPNDYGLFCYDSWEEQEEKKDENGQVIEPYRAKGDLYSLRYEEVLVVECKYLRRCIARLTARIEELEKGNNIK